MFELWLWTTRHVMILQAFILCYQVVLATTARLSPKEETMYLPPLPAWTLGSPSLAGYPGVNWHCGEWPIEVDDLPMENWCFSASMLGYRRIYVGMFCPKYPKHATGTGLPRCGQGPLPSAGFLFQCPKSQDAAGQDTVMKSTHPKGFCA
jgi:hypothetical protein